MIVSFAIETSCDETAIAIVDNKGTVIAESLISQNHQEYGGVYPEYAARQHNKIIAPMINQMFAQSNLTWNDIDIISSTVGPGLIGGLVIGVMVAKSIAMVLEKPFIAVNHLEAHLLTVRLKKKVPFPFLTLLVSGGHTQIMYSKGIGNHIKIGSTLDDAVGECFDKVAKMLSIPYPGGPVIEKLASMGDENYFAMPRPLFGKNDYDFSFSGLKTHVRSLIQKIGILNDVDKNNICASFQKCISDILIDRVNNSLQKLSQSKVNFIVVSGGVASNLYIRDKMTDFFKINKNIDVIFPPIRFCTDNAVMVGWAGIENYSVGLQSNLSQAPQPRLKL